MTQLTIPDVAIEQTYSVVSSSTGPFVVPFPFFDEDDVFATVTDAAGTVTQLIHQTGFTFTTLDTPTDQIGNGYESGEITLLNAIGSDGATTIKVFRVTGRDRTANFPVTGLFDIALLNDELNRLTMMMQEIIEYTLLRDGTDTMRGDLDMDGYRIRNLIPATEDDEPITLAQYVATSSNPADIAGDETITGQWTLPNDTILLDPSGNERRIAFRRNVGRYVSGSTTMSQDDDDSFIEYNGAGGDTLTMADPLEAGTTITILNTGSGPLTVAEDTGTTLEWLNGSSVLFGNRSLAVGGVMTVKYESDGFPTPSTASLAKCWGLGVS